MGVGIDNDAVVNLDEENSEGVQEIADLKIENTSTHAFEMQITQQPCFLDVA